MIMAAYLGAASSACCRVARACSHSLRARVEGCSAYHGSAVGRVPADTLTKQGLPPGPGQIYASRINISDNNQNELAHGSLRFDAAQVSTLQSLDRLHKRLHNYGIARMRYEVKLDERIGRIKETFADESLVIRTRSSGQSSEAELSFQSGIHPTGDEVYADSSELALKFVEKFGRSPGDFQRSGNIRVPRGLYIYGSVGTGKSLCMDLLHETSSIPADRKRRLHFHDFMAEAHRRVHEWKMRQPALSGKEALEHVRSHRHRRTGKIVIAPEADALVNVARDMASEAWLLCFDEFQVTDVADALIMSKLFGTMWACGTVVVATSNRAPDGLYENGLNRHYFLPFIDNLERQCKLHCMESSCDHRLLTETDDEHARYILDDPSNPDSSIAALDSAYDAACKAEIDSPHFDASEYSANSATVIVPTAFGRSLEISSENVCGGVCRFDFESLCKSDLGASDYRALALRFHTIVLSDIPRLTRRRHNEARRFIMLVDQLYENKVRLYCSAVSKPLDIFKEIGHEDEEDAGGSNVVGAAGDEDDPFGREISSNNVRVEELAAVQELHFAFQRASSRLVEMMSREYLATHQRERVRQLDNENLGEIQTK